MFKSLIIWSSITPSLMNNLIASNVLIDKNPTLFVSSFENTKLVNKNIIVDDFDAFSQSENDLSTAKDLHIYGKNSDTHFRIFIDSGGDRWLPSSPIGKHKDYIIGKGRREEWYNHLIPGISLDVTNYATNKAEFLEKYRAITFSYSYNYNFWNSKMGWSHNEGKNTPLVTAVKTYEVTPTNNSRLIFEEKEASHSNNESARLLLKQEWSGNILKYDFYLGVSYYWKNASPINHASFASFTSDLYSFVFVPESEREKVAQIYHLDQESEFTFGYHTSINLTDLDEKLRNKSKEAEVSNSVFKTVTLFVAGYYGTKRVGGTTYVYSIMIRSAGFPSRDSASILNGSIRTRTLAQIYQRDELHFHYLNSQNQEEKTEKKFISSVYFGINLTGLLYSPFIYTI